MTRPRSLLSIAVLLAACAHVAGEPAPAKVERVYVTGSRLAQRVDLSTGLPATISPVRIYGRTQMDNTGRVLLRDSLWQLDPSIR